jgi:hypothetical protein
MKTLLLAAPLLTGYLSSAQATTVQVRLFVPAHISNGISPESKLKIHFLPFPGDTTVVKKIVVAKRVKENIYEFQLPNTRLHHIGFSIGNFSAQMLCIDNTEGDAAENYDFDILLENVKKDYSKPFFLPPCIVRDED